MLPTPRASRCGAGSKCGTSGSLLGHHAGVTDAVESDPGIISSVVDPVSACLEELAATPVAVSEVVLNNLYKQTPMQSVFGINMVALVDGQPRLLNLKQVLEAFIAHRREVVTRRTLFELRKARARAHILEGLLKALDILDRMHERGAGATVLSELAAIHASRHEWDQALDYLDREVRLRRYRTVHAAPAEG
mgnify:CR=1 FL=1